MEIVEIKEIPIIFKTIYKNVLIIKEKYSRYLFIFLMHVIVNVQAKLIMD